MTTEEKPPEKPDSDDKNRFDMYHFLSRWDFMLAIGVIVLFLLWLAGHMLHGSPGI